MIYLRKTSLVDFPGKISAALFFAGCNLRCPWCQNSELLIPPGAAGGDADQRASSRDEHSRNDGLQNAYFGNDSLGNASLQNASSQVPGLEEALAHIQKRRSHLGGVVLSGGEPTLSKDLGAVAREIKRMGVPLKLDTNGMNPVHLAELCSQADTRPDYIALDLKIAPYRYGELLPGKEEAPPYSPVDRAGAPGFTRGKAAESALGRTQGSALEESAAVITDSGIAHEYRTLALPGSFIDLEDIRLLAPLVDDAPWYFRPFVPGNCFSREWNLLDKTGSAEGTPLVEEARKMGKNPIGIFSE